MVLVDSASSEEADRKLDWNCFENWDLIIDIRPDCGPLGPALPRIPADGETKMNIQAISLVYLYTLLV